MIKKKIVDHFLLAVKFTRIWKKFEYEDVENVLLYERENEEAIL